MLHGWHAVTFIVAAPLHANNLNATKFQQVCHHFLQVKLEKQAAEYAPLPIPPQQPSQPQASKPPPVP